MFPLLSPCSGSFTLSLLSLVNFFCYCPELYCFIYNVTEDFMVWIVESNMDAKLCPFPCGLVFVDASYLFSIIGDCAQEQWNCSLS